MKRFSLLLGVLSLSSAIAAAPGFTAPASAQCLQSHIGLQVKFGKPVPQTNDVTQEVEGSCRGNVQTSTIVQVDKDVNSTTPQHQVVEQRVRGGRGNGTGIEGPTVKSNIVVPIHIQTPEGFNP